MLLAVGTVAYLTSCDTGVDPVVMTDAPTISITDADGATISSIDGQVGDQTTFTVTVEADGGFNVLRYGLVLGADSTGIDELVRQTAGDTVFTTDITYTFVDSLVDQLASLVFEAVDDSSRVVIRDLDVNTTAPPNPIISYTATLLSAPLQDDSNANWFSSEDGETYSNNNVINSADPISSTIDFGYYYGASNNASLASPNAWVNDANLNDVFGNISAWGTKNETEFRTTSLTAAEFDAIGANDGDDIAAAFEGGTDDGGVITNLSEGQVVAFRTDADKANSAGKFGLIKIVTITGTFNANDGVTIDVKLEE
ncbi:MAG TPA: hypothetical protein DCE41_28325 [Cytophagales bacterium]|nr:hypothetical protein [Cytophagales bacterium]HAA18422.1 hypothetical protein [Cytophagales bacterium]